MEVFLIAIALLLSTAFYFYFLKNTVFGIDLYQAQYSGFFIFFSFLSYIFISSFALNSSKIETFWVAFKVSQESVFPISVLIIAMYFVFLITLFFVSYVARDSFGRANHAEVLNPGRYINFVRYSVFFCLLLMVVAWLFYGKGHSFSLAIMENTSVSTLRAEITGGLITKFIKYFYVIVCPLLFSILFTSVFENKKYEKLLLSILVVFISAWGGSKGPVLTLLLIAGVTHMSIYGVRITFFTLIKVLFSFLLLLFLTYQIVLLQYSNMVDLVAFLDYFTQRVFVAQIIGVYEQFNLFLQDDLYLLHGVPFASFFIDYPIFHKDLMMVTEDRVDPSTIGIKNTFFIAEAYGMGGWPLLLVSPIIFGVNFSISFILFFKVLNQFFPHNNYTNKLISSVFIFSYIDITGGFSDLMLFKLPIMLLGLLTPVWLIAFATRFNVKFNNIQKAL